MPAPDQIDINKQQCHDNVCPVLQDQYAVAPVKGSDNFVYSGYCVADLVDGSTRVFTAKKVFVDLTQAMCADHCSTRGYDVAGIEKCASLCSPIPVRGDMRLTLPDLASFALNLAAMSVGVRSARR